jgi:hypothetical protein
VGKFHGKKHDLHGTPFEGSDEEWEQYLMSVLPGDEDEAALREYFKEEWIQYREWKE